MADAVDIPVTIKTRLGVDEQYSYEFFSDFVGAVASARVKVVIAHARIALLSGLSPKENREVPPLHHDWVHRLKREMPQLTVVINGGIDSLAGAREQLEHVDGVMLGRAAYQTPWVLAQCQAGLYGGSSPRSPDAVVGALVDYLERQSAQGVEIKHITRHLLGKNIIGLEQRQQHRRSRSAASNTRQPPQELTAWQVAMDVHVIKLDGIGMHFLVHISTAPG